MAETKGILCVFYYKDRTCEKFMAAQDVVTERQKLRTMAQDYMQTAPESAENVVYYQDERCGNDQIWKAHFYHDMRIWSDAQLFYELDTLA